MAHVFLSKFFAQVLAPFALMVLFLQGARASDSRVEITNVCKGTRYIATVESFIGPDGLPIAMERIPVTEIGSAGKMIWELWSHRDGETWSERPLLTGLVRKGIRIFIQGFVGRLERVDQDKSWPESEEILDLLDCWPVANP